MNKNKNGVFNIASGKAITINETVNLVLAETQSKSKIIYEKERPGDIKHSLANIEDTKKHLNFQPKFDLIEGLQATVKYFIEKTNKRSS